MPETKSKELTDALEPASKQEAKKEIDAVDSLSSDVEKRYIEIVKDNARKEEFSISGKIWKRRKMTHKEYKEVIKLRKELNKLDRKKDEELWESKHEEVYKTFAKYCLVSKDTNTAMTDDDYDSSEAGEIERIIDGINFRISYGLPSAQ